MKTGTWFNSHVHSNMSYLDGMTAVPLLVKKAHKLGYPAFVLNDHGNMAGTVKAYKTARSLDLPFFPGVEGYLIDPNFIGKLEESGKEGRFHFVLHALDLKGYQALVRFVSLTHTRPRFNRFPRCTLEDLATLGAEAGEHLSFTTGCFFGYLQQTLITEGEVKALRVAKMFAGFFPNTFIELQHHNIDHIDDTGVITDDDIVTSLHGIAQRAGLPVLAGQDNHYLTRAEKSAHQLMKRMVYGGVEDEFPGDSFHLASEEWVQEHYPPDIWADVLEGHEHLLEMHDLTIPPLDTYKAQVPQMSKTADSDLKSLCDTALRQYLRSSPRLMSKKAAYNERLVEELAVIKKVGMANYFLHMKQTAEWCRRKKYVIEARGSAGGSLVTFLIKLTQVDPLIWGTTFMRFLAEDRISPPDVDMDIEYIARPHVLTYLMKNGEAIQIGNHSDLGQKEGDEADTGSAFRTYVQSWRRRCVEDAWEREKRKAEREGRKPVKGDAERKGAIDFQQNYAWIQTVEDVRKVDEDDYIGLKQIIAMGQEPGAGVKKSYGVHASGILISGKDFSYKDWVPTMLVASSNTLVSQYDMHDVEEFGMLKDDWLGQRSLTVMRRCQELMGRSDPTDFSWIPEDDPATCREISKGIRNNGIFHFEAPAKSQGVKEMGVKSTADCVLATALYMPGAVESGQKDLYIQRRRSQGRTTRYLHPIFETVCGETYGTMIYQEQTIGILRELGMENVHVNAMYKLVKDMSKDGKGRNAERLAKMHDEFNDRFLAQGMSKKDLPEAWRLTTGFVKYGFNKAHAAAYGIRSYRTGYLKTHHTLEYMSALLETWAGTDKETIYVREARRVKLRILQPHVNISGATWSIDRKKGAIRRGLVSIPGIGPAAANEIEVNAPYNSIDDLAKKCNPKSVPGGKAWLEKKSLIGGLRKLEDVGALDGLER